MRENSLLAVMYATMTFPSNLFDVEKILEKVAKASADSRRRVRHAALEALAILSQFCSSEKLTESVARVAETLPCNVAKAALISAVHARLSRRVLPTVSNEGLVLYSLQIPASRRFGTVGNPSGNPQTEIDPQKKLPCTIKLFPGADVDWILSGTGSVSTGSARSRGQLNAAQRLEITTQFSPTKWRNNGQNKNVENVQENCRKSESENPWTKQKNRTESLSPGQSTQENWKNHRNRIHKSSTTGNLSGRTREAYRFSSSDNLLDDKNRVPIMYPVEYVEANGSFKPDEMSWALVPVSSLASIHIHI